MRLPQIGDLVQNSNKFYGLELITASSEKKYLSIKWFDNTEPRVYGFWYFIKFYKFQNKLWNEVKQRI